MFIRIIQSSDISYVGIKNENENTKINDRFIKIKKDFKAKKKTTLLLCCLFVNLNFY